jgi:hypothetical protein
MKPPRAHSVLTARKPPLHERRRAKVGCSSTKKSPSEFDAIAKAPIGARTLRKMRLSGTFTRHLPDSSAPRLSNSHDGSRTIAEEVEVISRAVVATGKKGAL